jgi:serine/threonine protein kinase
MMTSVRTKNLTGFDLRPGRVIGGKYVVDRLLGSGWEGEVYAVIERRTGVPRAAKLFYPKRNRKDAAADFYARKLERLRDCDLLIRYHASETVRLRGEPLTVLISEYVDGTLLEKFQNEQPGRRLTPFEALHMLHTLARGLEQIHARRDYHGDLHLGNILVKRRGIHFEVKLVDLYDLGRPSATNIRDDVVDLVHVFHEILGGRKWYAKQSPEIKWICGGLKRSLITRRFPTARHLREHLDSFTWSGGARTGGR